jgi:hypothetical protein
MREQKSHTGHYLRSFLERRPLAKEKQAFAADDLA